MKLEDYEVELDNRELAESTKKMYLRAVNDFLSFADGQKLTQDLLIEYKKHLLNKYKTSTVNTKTTIINNYLEFADKDISVKQERVQKSNILDDVLTETDFNRLIRMADTRGKERERVIMLILYYTGIRISELPNVTAEAVKLGYIDINNKGKHRRVPISRTLSKTLKQYLDDAGIESGPIIVNRDGNPLSRSYIFRQLKWIGGQARVKKAKVYPHSFRHLFAKQWLKNNNGNTLALADLLGHSSLETTRIYATLSTDEQRQTIDF